MEPEAVDTGTLEAIQGVLAKPGMVAGAIVASAFASIVVALGINKSRKTDAAEDRQQRERIADEDRKQRDRIADEDRKQRERAEARQAKDAAEDRQQRERIADAQLAAANRQADTAAQIEERRAKEADGTLKALTELLHRTAPPSPPGATEDKPDATASPNPDPGQDGADSMGADRAAGPPRTGADKLAMNGAHLSSDTLNSLFGKDETDEWMSLLGPVLWDRDAPVPPDVMVEAIQARIDAAAPGHPDRARGAKIIAFIRETEARRSAA